MSLKKNKRAKPWKHPKKREGGGFKHTFFIFQRVKLFCQCVNIDHVCSSYAELISPARQRIRRRNKSKHRSVFVSTGTFRCASVGPSSLRALLQDNCPADNMNRLPKHENKSGIYLLPLFRLDYTSRNSTKKIMLIAL
jgi:hypothetical protein